MPKPLDPVAILQVAREQRKRRHWSSPISQFLDEHYSADDLDGLSITELAKQLAAIGIQDKEGNPATVFTVAGSVKRVRAAKAQAEGLRPARPTKLTDEPAQMPAFKPLGRKE